MKKIDMFNKLSYLKNINNIINFKTMKNTGLFLGGLLTGAALGASIALLYAPQKGSETREQLRGKLKEMETELQVLRDKVKVKGGELKEEMKTKINELENKIESLIKEYKKNLEPTHGAN
jgi:gas vesicle protein